MITSIVKWLKSRGTAIQYRCVTYDQDTARESSALVLDFFGHLGSCYLLILALTEMRKAASLKSWCSDPASMCVVFSGRK